MLGGTWEGIAQLTRHLMAGLQLHDLVFPFSALVLSTMRKLCHKWTEAARSKTERELYTCVENLER
eukprot:5288574-Amphidinium_carterae.1